jgi:hypothetical protein
MAKNSVNDWSTTAASNEDVGGVDIRGSAQASNLNDAVQQMMAQIKTFVTAGTFTTLAIVNTTATLRFQDSNAASDKKIADIVNSDGSLYFYGRNDAGSTSNLGFALIRGSADSFSYAWIPVQLRTGDGTAASPSRSFFADSDTGDYLVSAGYYGFATGGTHRGGFNSDGSLLVGGSSFTGAISSVGFKVMGAGDTAPGAIQSTVSGFACAYLNRLASDGQIAAFHRSGTGVGAISVTTTATTYSTSSDERLKENFRDFDSGAIIDAMKMYAFDWKTGGQGYGPKAQELHRVFPLAVTPGNDKDPGDPGFIPWQWGESPLIAVLIQEIQSLRARVAALES